MATVIADMSMSLDGFIASSLDRIWIVGNSEAIVRCYLVVKFPTQKSS